jgi:putative protein-disulfide isomerase
VCFLNIHRTVLRFIFLYLTLNVAKKMSRLIYIYDALCGWCYGFSPVIRRFVAEHQGQFAVEVLSGGMMTGPRVQPISVSMSYIESAYKVVEERTGVQFGQAYLTNILRPGTYLSDSTKPGQAMTLFKAIQANQPQPQQVAFAAALQTALYHDGIDLNVAANYGPIVEPFSIDPDEFVAHLDDAAIREQTQQEFDLVARMQIGGFPSVIVEHRNELFLVARGYVPYKTLLENVQRATTDTSAN